MIVQYKLRLSLPDDSLIPSFWAYRLYAWLLDQIPDKEAGQFHNQEQHAITQYLDRDCIWTINLFGEKAAACFGNILEHTDRIVLHTDVLSVLEWHFRTVDKPEDFLRQSREIVSQRAMVQFVSPAAFKQAGRYAILPQEDLLLQSLLMKWNEACSNYSLQDADLLAEMKKGIHIVDYNLRTSRFQLKNTAIPCFYGKIFVEARLPIVLQEIWNALLCFAPYSGIGIKTTLGMGGVRVTYPERRKP